MRSKSGPLIERTVTHIGPGFIEQILEKSPLPDVIRKVVVLIQSSWKGMVLSRRKGGISQRVAWGFTARLKKILQAFSVEINEPPTRHGERRGAPGKTQTERPIAVVNGSGPRRRTRRVVQPREVSYSFA